jgi:hypothetical protein
MARRLATEPSLWPIPERHRDHSLNGVELETFRRVGQRSDLGTAEGDKQLPDLLDERASGH